MKTHLVCTAIFLAIAARGGAANDADASPLELPFQQVEVSVALKQYEKVRLMQSDAQLERELLIADSTTPKDKIATADRRLEIMGRELARLRKSAEDARAAAEAKVARAATAVAKLRLELGVIDPDPESAAAVLSNERPAHPKSDLERYVDAKSRYLNAKLEFQALFSPAIKRH